MGSASVTLSDLVMDKYVDVVFASMLVFLAYQLTSPGKHECVSAGAISVFEHQSE